MIFHLTAVRMSDVKKKSWMGCREKKPPLTVVEIRLSQPIKICQPFLPDIPLFDICSNVSTSYSTDICLAIFSTAIFMIAKKWRQLK